MHSVGLKESRTAPSLSGYTQRITEESEVDAQRGSRGITEESAVAAQRGSQGITEQTAVDAQRGFSKSEPVAADFQE